MPIYLVRWPGAKASLVGARDEEQLRLILAEVVDPSLVRWTEYKGPLWLDLDLPTADGAATIDAPAVVRAREVPLRIRFGATEAGAAMREVVARWALPRLQGVVDALNDALNDARDGEGTSAEHEQASARPWHERVARAVEADEAEMTLRAQRRLAQEAKLRAGRPLSESALRTAADRLAASLLPRRPSVPPALTLVRGDQED